MKKLILVIFSIMLSTGAMNAFAEAKRGQSLYLTHLKDRFGGMKGNEFAGQKLKVEWKRVFKKDPDTKKFIFKKKYIKKLTKKYPNEKKFLNSNKFQKLAPHIRDFVMKYAADSGEVASCD